jgi:Zn-dependent protease with chaperone function
VRMHLKVFIKSGVPFGVVISTMHFILMKQQVVDAVIMGLLCGYCFGIGMTLISLWNEKRLNKLGFTTANMNPIQQREIYIDRPVSQATNWCRDALLAIPNLHILSVDTANGFIFAKVGMTWFSWGESIAVKVLPHSNGSFAYIHSAPRMRFTIIHSCKGFENVEIFVRALVLQQSAHFLMTMVE